MASVAGKCRANPSLGWAPFAEFGVCSFCHVDLDKTWPCACSNFGLRVFLKSVREAFYLVAVRKASQSLTWSWENLGIPKSKGTPLRHFELTCDRAYSWLGEASQRLLGNSHGRVSYGSLWERETEPWNFWKDGKSGLWTRCKRDTEIKGNTWFLGEHLSSKDRERERERETLQIGSLSASGETRQGYPKLWVPF